MYVCKYFINYLNIIIYTVIIKNIYLRSNCELEDASVDSGDLSLTGLVLNEHPHRPHLKLPLNLTS